MAEFKLKIRRYDPETGAAPYWDEHTVDLEPHRSVLEGIPIHVQTSCGNTYFMNEKRFIGLQTFDGRYCFIVR